MISDNLKHGVINAPHRSLYHALGLTDEELQKPMVSDAFSTVKVTV